MPGDWVRVAGTEYNPEISALPIPFDGHGYVPHGLPANIDRRDILSDAWEDIEAADVALAGLEGRTRTLPNPRLLARPFQIREAQASSRIENTVATAEEVVLAQIETTERNEPREVRNYLTALEQGLDSEFPLGQTLLRGMHRTLLSLGVRGHEKSPGEYRNGVVYLKGETPGFEHARFVPPPADRVGECMDALETYIRDEHPALPRVVVAAITHYQFETIHPFEDGNGRLGRMLILLQLCRSGLISRPLFDISSFLDAHRETYFSLLKRVSLEGCWIDWIQFFCRGVARQAENAELRATALLDLRRRYMELVTEPRASALLRDLVDWLFAVPAVRVADVARHLHIKPQSAQRHVDRLVEKGILVEVTGGSYNRIYLASELLRKIEDPLNP